MPRSRRSADQGGDAEPARHGMARLPDPLELGILLAEEQPEAVERAQVLDLGAVEGRQLEELGVHDELRILRYGVDDLGDMAADLKPVLVLDARDAVMYVCIESTYKICLEEIRLLGILVIVIVRRH